MLSYPVLTDLGYGVYESDELMHQALKWSIFDFGSASSSARLEFLVNVTNNYAFPEVAQSDLA